MGKFEEEKRRRREDKKAKRRGAYSSPIIAGNAGKILGPARSISRRCFWRRYRACTED